MSTTTLVAGGAGFLGSHLCSALIAERHEVICIDNFGSGRRENIADLLEAPQFTLREADIRDNITLPPVDRIYHLASRASPAEFTEFPIQIALTNTVGTRHLLNHAVACDARMVFASTSEVYGDPETTPQPETYTGNVEIRGPRGCYDESKRFGETLTVAYENEYDIDVRTARIFNTYGPRMRVDDERVVPTFIRQALRGEDLTVYGDGKQTRSFCFVDDMIQGLRALMQSSGLQGEVLNLGRDNEVTIRSLADRVRSYCGTGSEVIHEPLPEDDPTRRCPDLSRARKQLNWDPTTSLNAGLQATIDDFNKRM
jgi:UDP-glucuronate decarboxylase